LAAWASGCRLSCSRCSCKLLRLEQQQRPAAEPVRWHLLLPLMRLVWLGMMSWSLVGLLLLLLLELAG
jgi:hypothetical protein